MKKKNFNSCTCYIRVHSMMRAQYYVLAQEPYEFEKNYAICSSV